MNETGVEDPAEDDLPMTRLTGLERAGNDVDPRTRVEGKGRRQTEYNSKEKDRD